MIYSCTCLWIEAQCPHIGFYKVSHTLTVVEKFTSSKQRIHILLPFDTQCLYSAGSIIEVGHSNTFQTAFYL